MQQDIQNNISDNCTQWKVAVVLHLMKMYNSWDIYLHLKYVNPDVRMCYLLLFF